jgi:hypothetical protein
MPPAPIRYDAANLNLASRFFRTAVVVASPAAAAETIIASVSTSGDIAAIDSVYVSGWAAFTVGTNGTAARFRLRQTNVAGTVIADSGALTGGIAATNLVAQDIQGNDTAPVLPGQVYVMTLQITAGSASSTVSAVSLWAFVA